MAELPKLGPIINARWKGECTECGWEWEPGDEIRYYDEDLIGQECCGEQLAAEGMVSTREPLTPDNFLDG